jgi:hypothetical protein
MASPVTLLCLGLALVACGAAPEAAAPMPDADASAGAPAPAQPPVPLLAQQTSGFTEPVELVLRDRAALADAWRTLHAGLPGNPPPSVDLVSRMVVLVALGERSTGGHDVRVDGVVPDGDGATVRYTVTQPGPGCMTTQMITSPVVAVSVPRVAGDVRFERRTATQAC